MRSMRQVLDAGVRWQMIDVNPAKMAGPNPEPPVAEVLTFASVGEVERLAIELGPWGSAAVFGAETGLRPSEWIALEWGDLSRADRVVTVNRTFAKGRLGDYGKTAGSRRRVPLTARALDALATTPRRLDRRLIFPASQGGYLDLNNFRRREWAPAVEAAGLPGRTIYALRHTFASFALDAGVSIFELARFMGTGVRMIDRTYGHLVRGSEDQVRVKLEARTARDLADVGDLGAPEPRADGLNRHRR